MTRESHPSDAKIATAKEFAALLKEYPIIAAINVESLPAMQLQTMREKLRADCTIRMAKRRVMYKAIETVAPHKEGLAQLNPYLRGMPALLFTKQNPFALFKTAKQNKSKAPAKAGQRAPYDIVVPAGPTPFAPGPIIGELGAIGVKSGVEGGKVAVKVDSIVAREGDIISAKLASLLLRLGIQPMEIGLDITAVYEKGMIMTRTVLDVDDAEYARMLRLAVAQAIAISLETGLLNADTRELAVARAAREASTLAVAAQLTEDGLNLSESERAVFVAMTSGPAPAAAGESSSAAAPAAEKKEEKNEEAAAEGLGSLFG